MNDPIIQFSKAMQTKVRGTLTDQLKIVYSKDMKLISKRRIFLLALILLIILVIFGFFQYQKYQKAKNDPQHMADQLIAKVGEIISLPGNEVPVIAQVSDKTKLPQVPFYANAQNGDEVLIYKNSGKAFLYRPSINKIIEVTTIAPEPTIIPTVNPKATPKITPKAPVSSTGAALRP
jgi:hypothetical protein